MKTIDTYRSVDRTVEAVILFDEFRGKHVVVKYDGIANEQTGALIMIKRKTNVPNLIVARDIANIWIEQRV